MTRTIIIESGSVRAYPNGASIFALGNLSVAGVITTGRIQIYSDIGDGRRASHRHVHRGSLVGLGALIGTGSIAAAEAMCPTRILLFDLAVIRKLLRHDGEFAFAVASEVHAQMADMAADSLLRMRGYLAKRIAMELLDVATESAGGRVVICTTHETLASALGTTREVVSRHLRSMSRNGLVTQVGRGQIVLNDRVRLLAFGRGLLDS